MTISMPPRVDSRSAAADATGCVTAKAVFQHPLMEQPPTAHSPAAERATYAALTSRASAVCASCPLMKQCLFDAVVKFDVDGYVAGTTRKQRHQIRKQLNIRVAAEDFDSLAGITRSYRQIDSDDVVRLRATSQDSLDAIAARLGCSISTVKRHLRRARNEAAAESDAQAGVAAIGEPGRVTVRQVVEAYLDLAREKRPRAARAA